MHNIEKELPLQVFRSGGSFFSSTMINIPLCYDDDEYKEIGAAPILNTIVFVIYGGERSEDEEEAVSAIRTDPNYGCHDDDVNGGMHEGGAGIRIRTANRRHAERRRSRECIGNAAAS